VSDAALRELEQAWRRSGSVEDEAQLLAARVRSGDLEEERLRLAAHAGYPAAVRALGESCHERPLAEWLDGFAAFGEEALSRASIAIARLAWSRWPGFSKHPPLELSYNPIDTMVEGAVVTAEDYLCEASAESLALHTEAGQQVASYAETPLLSSYERAVALATLRGAEQARGAGEAFERAEVREAVATEIALWALMGRDPVRERVEERQRWKLLAVAAHLGHQEARRRLEWQGPIEADIRDRFSGIVFVEPDQTWQCSDWFAGLPYPMVVEKYRHLVVEVGERLLAAVQGSARWTARLERALEDAADRELGAAFAVAADLGDDAATLAEEVGGDLVERVLAEVAQDFFHRALEGQGAG